MRRRVKGWRAGCPAYPRAMAPRRSQRANGRTAASVPVWPADSPDLPPLDGIIPALESFEQIGDASPLDVELTVSRFLGMLGAGLPEPLDDDEPDHEELINGLVEVCLHHLENDPPRVIIDFLWVLDAFDLGSIQWPLHDRLVASAMPSAPAWAWAVGSAEIGSTHLVEHETGDGYDVAIIARHPGADADHVIAVYIDRTLGGLARDLLVHHDGAEFLQRSADEPGMTVRDIDPATAAATIDEAVDAVYELGGAAPVAAEFAAHFTLVDHYVAKLPPGGMPLPVPEPATSAEQIDVVERFVASPEGASFADDREALIAAVEFVVDELGGDPLRWTPVVTQIVLSGWVQLAGFDAATVDRFPDLLRAFVPWAQREQGWEDRYATEALAVIDAVEADTGEAGPGQVEILEQAMAAGVDLDDPDALDAFLDSYLDD